MSPQPTQLFDGKRVLITGGTGSLGKTMVRRLLESRSAGPDRIVVMSRDEAKQHQMRVDFAQRLASTDEIVYDNFRRRLQFRIGDVRDFDAVALALRDMDVVIHAAAMKQVPTCEYFPFEAVNTNVAGAHNIVTAIHRHRLPVETVVGISTDKAVMPVNVMGMSKALQERLFIAAQVALPETRMLIVRYGNVMASRGSVIPLFQQQIRSGGPVTVTDLRMTRFLFTLSDAVDTICAAIGGGRGGETIIPRIPSAKIIDVARAMIGARDIELKVTGIRPGEKLHEILISSEESSRVQELDGYFVVRPMLPEIGGEVAGDSAETWEYSSGEAPLAFDGVRQLLESRGLIGGQAPQFEEELLV
jgi:UDP-glucose 4-epimerase